MTSNKNKNNAPIVKGVYLPLTNTPIIGNFNPSKVKSVSMDKPVGKLAYMDLVDIDHTGSVTTDPEYLSTFRLIEDAMKGKFGKEVHVSRYKTDRLLIEYLGIPHDRYSLFGDHIDMPIRKVKFVDGAGNSAVIVPEKNSDILHGGTDHDELLGHVVKNATKTLSDSINKKLIQQLINKKNP